MAFRLTPPQIQWLDQYANPLTGGQLFFYQTGSSSLAETYADAALTIPNPNPIILDASGSCTAPFLNQGQLYKVVLEDQNGVILYTVDPVSDPTSTGASVTSNLAITDQPGTPRTLFLQTAGKDRFGIALDAVNESGNNAGSNLVITSYNDDGSPNTVVMTVNRANGSVDFAEQPTVAGGSFSGLVGMIGAFPSTIAPSGWLACDGSLVSRTMYAALWAFANGSANIVTDAVWTAAGSTSQGAFSQGDGSTTFRLPDYRGYFLRGWAGAGTVDTGRGIGSKQSDALQTHTHPYTVTQVGSVPVNGSGSFANAGTDPATTGNNSGNTASETRPINLAALYCIKT